MFNESNSFVILLIFCHLLFIKQTDIHLPKFSSIKMWTEKKSAKSQTFVILLSQTLAELKEEEKNK